MACSSDGIGHPAGWDEAALLADCEVTRGRRGGPGGQHRNKVETAVRIVHVASGVVAEASERRSQADNRSAAVFRLRVKLALSERCRWVGPSDLWQRRTAGGRISVNEKHAELPAVLAESLDALAASGGQDGEAARALGVSRSGLVKFWKRDGAWLAACNAVRSDVGLGALR